MFRLSLAILIEWTVFFGGYPIYKKIIKREKMNWNVYVIGLNIPSVCLQIINLIMLNERLP